MKKIAILIFILVPAFAVMTVLSSCSSASGENWKSDITWTEPGITESDFQEADKPVFIFFHTEWCSFCTKMKQLTFSDPDVQKLLNENFINLEINPETQGTVSFTGREMPYANFARQLGVTGYPATFFFDEKGKLIGGQPGYMDKNQLAQLAEYIGKGFYKEIKFQEFMQLSTKQKKQLSE